MLGFAFKDPKERKEAFAKLDVDGNGRVSLEEFVAWWNKEDSKDGARASDKQTIVNNSVRQTTELGIDDLM